MEKLVSLSARFTHDIVNGDRKVCKMVYVGRLKIALCSEKYYSTNPVVLDEHPLDSYTIIDRFWCYHLYLFRRK